MKICNRETLCSYLCTLEQDSRNTRDLIGLFLFKVRIEDYAQYSDADVKNFAVSPQNVSNAVETISPVNARNPNKTPSLNVQTVTNNIRATSQDMKQEQGIYRDHN
jgi:hypothetical protein